MYPHDQLPSANYYSFGVIKESRGKLLPHQQEVLERLKKWFTDDSTKDSVALVSMPTGSGKTGIIACLPYFLGSLGLEEGPYNTPAGNPSYLFDKPILVLAPDLAITKQLEQQLCVTTEAGVEQAFLIKRGIVPVHMHRKILPTAMTIQKADHLSNRYLLESRDMVITNAQKFVNGKGWEDLPDDLFRLVIVDEAHHHPAETWRRIVEKFQNHALVVFFTATPFRGDGKPVLEDGKVAVHLRLDDAVGQGIIRQTKFEELDGTSSLVQLYRDHAPEVQNELSKMVIILEKVKKLLTTKNEQYPLPDATPHMAMVVARDTFYADNLLELWNKMYPDDNSAETYYSKMDLRDKSRVMDRLKNNELSVVFVVAMLLEGFDHPPVSVAAIACKIKSPVKFVQFVGRAQRIYRGGGRQEVDGIAHIVTHKSYKQKENYGRFIDEALIPDVAEEEEEDELLD